MFYGSDEGHYSQIYTGLHRLHRLGIIELKQQPRQRCPLSAHARPVGPPMLVSIEEKLAAYDVVDGRGLCDASLNGVDAYFKRGYDRHLVDALPAAQRDKVRPLGLNYRVLDDGIDGFALARAIRTGGMKGILGVARSLGMRQRFVPRVSTLEQPPIFGGEPRVLFLTRLWNTANAREFAGMRRHSEVDAMRIACIKALKAELGSAFVGGIAPGPVAARQCDPDLLADPRLVTKRAYMALMKSTPICITTTGLFDSNGWKLGEYVAHSKAILCEPLVHDVPGDFSAGENYLEFTSADECVEQAVLLMTDSRRRERMMLRNFHYYQNFLKPEWLVFNTLAQVIAGEQAHAPRSAVAAA